MAQSQSALKGPAISLRQRHGGATRTRQRQQPHWIMGNWVTSQERESARGARGREVAERHTSGRTHTRIRTPDGWPARVIRTGNETIQQGNDPMRSDSRAAASVSDVMSFKIIERPFLSNLCSLLCAAVNLMHGNVDQLWRAMQSRRNSQILERP